MPVFKTGAFVRSANPPRSNNTNNDEAAICRNKAYVLCLYGTLLFYGSYKSSARFTTKSCGGISSVLFININLRQGPRHIFIRIQHRELGVIYNVIQPSFERAYFFPRNKRSKEPYDPF